MRHIKAAAAVLAVLLLYQLTVEELCSYCLSSNTGSNISAVISDAPVSLSSVSSMKSILYMNAFERKAAPIAEVKKTAAEIDPEGRLGYSATVVNNSDKTIICVCFKVYAVCKKTSDSRSLSLIYRGQCRPGEELDCAWNVLIGSLKPDILKIEETGIRYSDGTSAVIKRN